MLSLSTSGSLDAIQRLIGTFISQGKCKDLVKPIGFIESQVDFPPEGLKPLFKRIKENQRYGVLMFMKDFITFIQTLEKDK